MEKVHGRSIQGFDLHDALMKCKDYINGFGGHTMAVGVSVSKDKFQTFKEILVNIAKQFDISKLTPILYIDDIIQIDEINRQMVEELSLLEPYGEANEIPIFAFKNLKIDSIRGLSDGKHLKLSLKSNRNTYVNNWV